jgi:hypothetical protein
MNLCVFYLNRMNFLEVRRLESFSFEDQNVFCLDYFSFIKRLMELLRMFTRIRKIELEIQTINDNTLNIDHPSMFSSIKINIFSFYQIIKFQLNNM